MNLPNVLYLKFRFNSWALHDSPALHTPPIRVAGHGKAGFNFPFFYTMFHMVASCIAALVMQLTVSKPKDGQLPSFEQFWRYKHMVVPLAFLTTINNGLNNASLGMIALYMNQVIKATQPLPTSFFEYCFLGKVYNLQIYFTITLIVVGVILAQATSFSHPGNNTIQGVIYVLISTAAATVKPVLGKLIMTGGDALNPCGGSCGSCLMPKKDDTRPKLPPLSPAQVLFWDAGISVWLFLIWSIASGEFARACDYLGGIPPPGYQINEQQGLLGGGIILFGSFLAFIFNIAMYYFVHYTSALTSTIGSIAVKIELIVEDAAVSGENDPLTWIGITVVVLSIVLYGYASYQLKLSQDAAATKPADEKTPLAEVVTK